METRLKLVFPNQTLRLVFKSLIFAGFLILAKLSGFNLAGASLFLIGSVVLYAKPLFRTAKLIWLFAVLLVAAFLTIKAAPGGLFLAIVAYFSFLFYLMLGVKELIFLKRNIWYRFLNLGLAYPLFLLFFYHNQSLFLVKLLLLFVAVTVLFKDFIKKRAAVWLLSLLVIEFVWTLSLLPVGFISAANIMFLIYFILSDFALRYYTEGRLTKQGILANVSILVVLAVLIFALSSWTI